MSDPLVVSMTQDELRALIRREVSPAVPAFYDQDNSPLGSRRHLELCRAGKLRSHKVGRSLFVRSEDVHAFIELAPPAGSVAAPKKRRSKRSPAPPPAPPTRQAPGAADLLSRARSI